MTRPVRILRAVVAALLGPPLVVIAAVTGTVVVLLFAPPGRALTARLLTERITGAVAGRVEIGSLGGGFSGIWSSRR